MMNEQCSLQWEESGEVKKISHNNSFTAEHELLPWIWSEGHKQRCLQFQRKFIILEKWKWKRKHNKTKLRWANSKEEFTSDFTASFPGAYLLTFSREEEKELLGTKVQIVKSYDDVIGNSLLTSKFTSASIAYFQRKGSMPDTNWLQTFNELVKLRNCWHS